MSTVCIIVFCVMVEWKSACISFFIAPTTVFVGNILAIGQVIQPLIQDELSVSSLIFNVLHKLSKNLQAVFGCTIWSIWKQMNYLIWRSEIIYGGSMCKGNKSVGKMRRCVVVER